MRIPEFTRTVLPDRAVGAAAIQVARAPHDIAAEGLGELQRGVRQAENTVSEYALRDAQAKNTTAVNEKAIEYKKQAADLEAESRRKRGENPENFHKDFDGELKKLSDQYVESMPSEAARIALRESLGTQNASMYTENLSWEISKKTENYASSVDKSQKTAADISAQRAKVGQPIDDLLRDMDATAVAGSTIVDSPDKVEKIRLAGRARVIDAAINSAIQYNPAHAKELIEKYSSVAKGGFDGAIKKVMSNEGGFVAVDGASGAPAIYGINEKWHKEAYAEAKKITDTKGEAAGKAYAQQFYKKEYWDKNGIGELPPETQTIVFDGAVNHSANFTKQLIAAAKGGASPDELVSMREKEYKRLAKSPQYAASLPGWLNRLDALKPELSMTPEQMEKYDKEANAAVLKFDENKQIDQVVQSATAQWDLYNTFAEGDLTLKQISSLETEGKIEPKFADYMRKQIIKQNPVTAEDQSKTYSALFDEVMNLQLSTRKGKVKIGNSDVTLETLSRLQTKIIKESARGVTGLDSLLKQVNPALMSKADRERGVGDKGIDLGGLFGAETYDTGYQSIQNYLEKHGQENNLALKSDMLSSLVEQADALPKEVTGNKAMLEKSLNSIANNVIAKSIATTQMTSIPIPAINKLLNNPSLAPKFDEMFGVGSADKVLGK